MAAQKKLTKTATNNRGQGQRATGGQAGGRAGRPSSAIAGMKDKSVRVPASWNATTVDPTNQRGQGQRPTGGQAGGRAGKPSGSIARPAATPTVEPQSGVKGSGYRGTPANYNMLTNPTQNRGAGQRPTGGQAGGRAGLPTGRIAGLASALSGKAGTVQIGNLKSGLAGIALGGLSDRYLSPLVQKAGTALGENVVIPAARALDDAMPGMNSTDESRRAKAKAKAKAIADLPVRSAYYSSSPNPPNPPKASSKAPEARSRASSSTPAPAVRNPAPQRTPAPSMVRQSKNMDENYASWTKANKGLAEKVKPGQVGYDAIQKALGKTTSVTAEAKPAAKAGSSSGSNAAIQSLESDPKAKPFNTDKMPTKSDKEKTRQLQALRIAKRNAGVA